MDSQIVGTCTSTINEKCQAFVIYCTILGGRFRPYLTQSLELTLLALQFYFHEGVREAACRYIHAFSSRCLSFIFGWGIHADAEFRLIPLLTSCGKSSGTLTPPMLTPPPPNSSIASRSRPTRRLSPHCTKPSETRCTLLGCTRSRPN